LLSVTSSSKEEISLLAAFIFDVKSEEELFNLPVEETYKLIKNMKFNIEKETNLHIISIS